MEGNEMCDCLDRAITKRSSEPSLLQNGGEDKSLWFRCVNTFSVALTHIVFVSFLSISEQHHEEIHLL